MTGITFYGFYQLGNQVMALAQLHVNISKRILPAISQANKIIICAH